MNDRSHLPFARLTDP